MQCLVSKRIHSVTYLTFAYFIVIIVYLVHVRKNDFIEVFDENLTW